MSTLSTFRERASVSVEGTAAVGVVGTIFVALLVAGLIGPLVSTPVEVAVIGWSSGFLLCYSWMAYWLRGRER